ncbi:unnamed protein product [Arabidopsis lyrata]|nr:unnamed protein product [Arabidopsis lyrata]
MLDDEKKTYLEKLELIDDLQKLDLHATALEFQLFRQHGFNVSEDVFDVFMENCGKFESNNINDIISLYEASYLSTKSNTQLQKLIRTFATQKLRDFVDTHSNEDCGGSCDTVEMVVQTLDMPYYWRMRRLATRWYIDVYRKRHNKNLVLVEFAKIDFNIVQAIHQEELKYVSR